LTGEDRIRLEGTMVEIAEAKGSFAAREHKDMPSGDGVANGDARRVSRKTCPSPDLSGKLEPNGKKDDGT